MATIRDMTDELESRILGLSEAGKLDWMEMGRHEFICAIECLEIKVEDVADRQHDGTTVWFPTLGWRLIGGQHSFQMLLGTDIAIRVLASARRWAAQWDRRIEQVDQVHTALDIVTRAGAS